MKNEKHVSDELCVGTGVVNISGKDAVILDPLNVKAIVFSQGTQKIALAECDLGGVGSDLTNAARQQASQKTGIPFKNICVAATHTHMTGSRKEDLTSCIVQAIVKACKSAKPVKMQTCLASEYTVAFNRRYWMKDGTVVFNPMFLNPDIVRPAGPIDTEVVFALFSSGSNHKAVASLTNFPLHCDTVKEYGAVFQKTGVGSPKSVSADYPYWLEQGLKKEFGSRLTSIFATGCCGNINHWDFSKPGPQSGHKTTTKRIGDALAKAICDSKKTLKAENACLGARSRMLYIPWRGYTAQELALAKKNLKKNIPFHSEEPSEREQFLARVRSGRIVGIHNRKQQSETFPLEVQAFRLSRDTAIVTLPGEMFVEHGLTLKNLSPFENTMVVELANTGCGYVPNRKAYSQGGYEAESAILAPGGAEMLVEAGLRMLKELKTDKV